MTDLTKLTLAQARAGLMKGEFTSKELTKSYIDAIDADNKTNAYITKTPELAMEAAEASDKKIQSGSAGILEGIPVGQKDLFCTKGVKTTAGSKILGNFVPEYESTVSQNMKDAGSVMLGKLNMDEFAMGSTNTNSAYGSVINPWKRNNDTADLTPGGSSGGSSAAVAAGLAVAATGTDTGGSIRQPGAFAGVVGLKPTYGRCSRYGIVSFASSLDQAGPITRTVEDAAIMLEAMAGYDNKDSTSVNCPVPKYESVLGQSIKGLKVGVPSEYMIDGMNPEIAELWKSGELWLKEAGAEIVPISLPHTKYALPVYYIIAPAEASSNLARYDGVRYGVRKDGESLDEMYQNTRAAGFGAEVQRRIMMGTYVLSAGYYDAYYLKAQRIRKLISEDFKKAFQKVDVIFTPTAPSAAFNLDFKPEDPVTIYLNDVLTVPASLAGLPGISIPAGLSNEGLPLGLQLISGAFQEKTLFKAAHALEKAAAFPSLISNREAA